MEARNTRPGGSVYPAKNRTAPGFPSTKAKTKNLQTPTAHTTFMVVRPSSSPPKKEGRPRRTLLTATPQRTQKSEERKEKKEKRGAVEKA
jgi:hypothetical protein